MKWINAHSKQMIIVGGLGLMLSATGRAGGAVPALPDDSLRNNERKSEKKKFELKIQEELKSAARDLAEVEKKRRLLEKKQNDVRTDQADGLIQAREDELDHEKELLEAILDVLTLKPVLDGKSLQDADKKLKSLRDEFACVQSGKIWKDNTCAATTAVTFPAGGAAPDPKTMPNPPTTPPERKLPSETTGSDGVRVAVIRPKPCVADVAGARKEAAGNVGNSRSPQEANGSAKKTESKKEDSAGIFATDEPHSPVFDLSSLSQEGVGSARANGADPGSLNSDPPPTRKLSGTVLNRRGKPVRQVVVRLLCTPSADVPSASTNDRGVFSWGVGLPSTTCSLSTEHEGYQDVELKGVDLTSADEVLLPPIYLEELKAGIGELARAIVGFEQSGASASPSAQKFFTNFFVSVPRPFHEVGKQYRAFGPRLRFWGDVRITSVPQQIQSTLGQFAVNFSKRLSEVKVNELAQASEVQGGLEYRIRGLERRLLPSFDNNTKNLFSASFVASGGYSTPLTPRDSLQVFRVPTRTAEPLFFQQPETQGIDFTGKDFVAFATRDRDRFFRQYYAGFRLKTYYFNNAGNPVHRFPAMFDLTLGQNEAVTGGRLRGAVFRFDWFYPLPFDSARYVYLYGTAFLKPARTNIRQAILLQEAPAGTPVPADNVVIISVPQINRDYYRFGVGIDAISLFQYIKEKNKEKPSP